MIACRLIQEEKDTKPYFKELVETAVEHQRLDATDMSQFYLVNLLSDFAKTEQLFDKTADGYEEKPLAIVLAQALKGNTTNRIRLFKKIGDTSLYIAGYFSDHIDSKIVDIDYYISMGEGAYKNLSGIFANEKTFTELYGELAGKFIRFVDILSEVRREGWIASNSELLRLYEKWLKTGNERIKRLLEKEGLVPAVPNPSKKH